MILRTVRCLAVAALVAVAAGTGQAQDFDQVTRNVEIDFPGSDGLFRYRLASGVPLPEPKTMQPESGWVELGREGKVACAVVIHPDASATERAAARELAAQIAFLTGATNGPEIVTPDAPVSAPVVCVVGVAPELFRKAGVKVPKQHEGFAIKTGQWKGRDAVFVAGHDRFGVYWGVQTLKQMLFREVDPKNHGSLPLAEAGKGRVLAPNGYCADWPDIQYRMSPSPGETGVRMGRCNTSYRHIHDGKTLKTRETLKGDIDGIHKLGLICVPTIGWLTLNGILRDDGSRTHCPLPSREICPVADMPIIESIVTMAFEAGGDGLSVQFDDIEPVGNHHEKCPLCKPRFKSMAEWQAFVLGRVFALAKRNGWDKRLFICCPTPYYQLRLQKDEELTKYFSTLCGFPGAGAFKFYHTAFVRSDLKRLADAGLINYAWWNNGIWAAKNGELLGYDVGFPRMGYSWGLFDIGADGMEKFFPERLAELRYLKGRTDLIFSGTGGDSATSIGSMFAWDPERFLFREDEYREWFTDNVNGKGVFGDRRVWEWATKPLAAKCLASGTLDKTDERRMDTARLAADLANATPNPRTGKTARQMSTEGLDAIQHYLAARMQFLKACKDLDGVVPNSATFARQAGCLLSVGPETLVEGQPPEAKPMELESWSAPAGMDLGGCALVPGVGGTPARLSVPGGKGSALAKRAIGLDVGGFDRLVLSCSLSRGTRLTLKAIVDGHERATNATGHGPDWQELILPLSGRTLDAFSLHLDVDPAIDKPAAEREALLRPLRLEPGRKGFDTVSLAQGAPLKFAEFAGQRCFRMATNKLVVADDRFVLSRHSFSVETEFVPIETSNFKIAGTRATGIPSYTGLPGWAVGHSWGRITFTLEDQEGIISTITSKVFPARYAPCHVLAVRDFENRQLRLYVNGKKVEVVEKGSGVFGDKYSNLGMSFDPWVGKSMQGLLRYVKVHDRALTEDEAQARFRQ
jgi:hypothetical protein